MRVTLSMIVKNESKYLKGCLDSVHNAVDEIIIVDTGSEDDTVAIARECGAKVYHFEWINDFSAARNYALSKSTGDWILYLDADERLTPDSPQELRRITAMDRNVGYEVTLRSIDDVGGRPNIMKYIRLFRNNAGVMFTGRVHEQIGESLLQLGYEIQSCNVEIEHLGYNIEEEGLREKARRNLALLLDEYRRTTSPMTAFHLGQTYNILRDFQSAERYFTIAASNNRLQPSYRAHSNRFLAALALDRKDLQRAHGFISTALSADDTMPLVNLVAGKILLAAGNGKEGTDYCIRAFRQNKAIVKGGEKSFFDVLVDPEVLSYHLIELGVEYKLPELFDFGFAELRALRATDDSILQEIEFVGRLMRNESLDARMIEQGVRLINAKNIPAYMKLIVDYPEGDAQMLLLSQIGQKYGSNPDFILGSGQAYLNRKMYQEAILQFEKFLNLSRYNPSVAMYLISAYLSTGKLPEALRLAERGIVEFGEIEYLRNAFQRVEESVRHLV